MVAGTGNKIENSYCYADVIYDNENICGLLVGRMNNQTLQNCYGYNATNPVVGTNLLVGESGSGNTVKKCYGPVAPFVGGNEGTASDLNALSSATTISGGTADGLPTALNANITTLSISSARSWTIEDGKTTFVAAK